MGQIIRHEGASAHGFILTALSSESRGAVQTPRGSTFRLKTPVDTYTHRLKQPRISDSWGLPEGPLLSNHVLSFWRARRKETTRRQGQRRNKINFQKVAQAYTVSNDHFAEPPIESAHRSCQEEIPLWESSSNPSPFFQGIMICT